MALPFGGGCWSDSNSPAMAAAGTKAGAEKAKVLQWGQVRHSNQGMKVGLPSEGQGVRKGGSAWPKQKQLPRSQVR